LKINFADFLTGVVGRLNKLESLLLELGKKLEEFAEVASKLS